MIPMWLNSTQLSVTLSNSWVELSQHCKCELAISPALVFGAMLSGLTFSITCSVHSFYCVRITIVQLSLYHSCLHHFDRTLHYFLYKFALMWLEFLIAEYSKSNSKVIQTAWYLHSYHHLTILDGIMAPLYTVTSVILVSSRLLSWYLLRSHNTNPYHQWTICSKDDSYHEQFLQLLNYFYHS